MKVQLADDADRRRAVVSLDESLLVEASAGTGKTTTMIGRLIHLVTTPQTGAERPLRLTEIVAITFTERAAQELKDRLRAELYNALAGADVARRASVSQALEDIDQAPIGTIHAFCARLLREYPIEAGVDVQFAVADERDSREIEGRTWSEWFAREMNRADPPEPLHRALAFGVDERALRELAGKLVAHRVWPIAAALLSPLPDVDWPDVLADMRTCFDRLTAGTPRKLTKAQLATFERMQTWYGELESLPDDERAKKVLDPVPFLSNGRSTAVSRDMVEIVETVRERLTHPIISGLVEWLMRSEMSDAGAGFLATYQAAKRAEGLLDFDDLLIAARDLVRTRPDVWRKIRRTYRTIIVDEFQDTDPVQCELVALLSSDDGGTGGRWTEMVPAAGRLCVVGDPKQSIYRFRGADIESYSSVSHLVGDDHVCHLRTNFRSRSRIIDVVNAVFSRAGVFRDVRDAGAGVSFQPQYEALVPRPDVADSSTHDSVQWVDSSKPLDGVEYPVEGVEASRPIEADLIARAIRRVVDGEWEIYDRESGHTRPVRFGDIAILYRASSHLHHVERALQRRSVPYRVVGGRGFFEREEIVRLISVLTVIDQPADALNVVAALRSPFFGVSDADLAHAALISHTRFDYRADIPEHVPTTIRDAFRILRELHESSRNAMPSELLQKLYARTQVLAMYAQVANGEQAVANLLKVLDEARRLESEGTIPFRRLVSRLRALRDEGAAEGEASLGENAGDQVTLMTIHKAKGLEFPVVIMSDLAADSVVTAPTRADVIGVRGRTGDRMEFGVSVSSPGSGARLRTFGWRQVARADSDRSAAEAVRLLYVALTRARDYLLLPRVAAPRKTSWLALIEGAPESGKWPIWTPEPVEDKSEDPGRQDETDLDALAARGEELESRRQKIRARASASTVEYNRPSSDEDERDTFDEMVPPDESPSALDRELAQRFGTVVHEALQRLSPGDDDASVEAWVHRLAYERALPVELVEEATRQVRLVLGSDIIRRASGASRMWKEVPVLLAERREQGVLRVTRGVCDLVFEESGALVLVDYKTNRCDPDKVRSLVEGYRSQMLEYRRALERATGRHVREAVLCFSGVDGGICEEHVEE